MAFDSRSDRFGLLINFDREVVETKSKLNIEPTNDRALFARFARSNLKFQEPGNGDTKLSGKGRGEDTCHMSS